MRRGMVLRNYGRGVGGAELGHQGTGRGFIVTDTGGEGCPLNKIVGVVEGESVKSAQ